MLVRVEKFAAFDSEFREYYFVSPRSGDLVVLSERQLRSNSAIKSVGRLGIDTEVPFLQPENRLSLDQCTEGCSARKTEKTPTQLARLKWLEQSAWWMRLSCRFLSLVAIARIVSHLGCFPRTMERSEVIATLRGRGAGPKNECLFNSLQQVAVLVKNRIPCRLTIGVWVPTQDMHAWAGAVDSIGTPEELITENSDKISHYQPVLRFVFT